MDSVSHLPPDSKPSSSWQRPVAITVGSTLSVALLAIGAWGIYSYHISSLVLFSCAIVTEGGGASILLATVFKGCKQATKQIQERAQARPELPKSRVPQQNDSKPELGKLPKNAVDPDTKKKDSQAKEEQVPAKESPVQEPALNSSLHSSQMQSEPPIDGSSLGSSNLSSSAEQQPSINDQSQTPELEIRVLTPEQEQYIDRFSQRGKKDSRELDRFNQLLPDRRIYVLQIENENLPENDSLRNSLRDSRLGHSSLKENSRGWLDFTTTISDKVKALPSFFVNKVTDLTDAVADKFTDLQSKSLAGGEYQRRLHFQLLSSLLDPLAIYFSGKRPPECGASDKIEIIYKYIKDDPRLKILFEVTKEEGSLHHSLFSCLNVLFSLRNFSSGENYLLWRQEFIKHLNSGYRSPEYQQAMKRFETKRMDENTFKTSYPQAALLQMLGSSIFNQVHFFDFATEIYTDVSTHTEENSVENNNNNKHVTTVSLNSLSRDPLIATMQEHHEKALHIPTEKGGGSAFTGVHKMLGGLNLAFKPMENNNFANTLWRAGYEREDGLFTAPMRIRFATPTEEKSGAASIIPQFKLFLDACRVKKQKIVSFQLQNPNPTKTRAGNEAHRLQLMQELSQDPSYKGTYLFVSFPLDGAFFNQKGKYEDLNDVEAFKEEFLCHLFGQREKSIQVSREVWESCSQNYTQEVKAILNTVHEIFFQKRGVLSAKERRIFQIITYSLVEEYILMGTQADYYHDQCKDAIDRAMLMVIVNYYLSQLRLGKENDPEVQKNLLVLTEYMAIFAKSTGMHHGRFDLSLEVLTQLRGLRSDEKRLFQASPICVNGQKFVLKDLLIPSNINLTYAPFPSEAPTKEEYQNQLQKYPGFSCEIPRFPNYLLVSEDKTPSEALIDLNKQWVKDLERQGFCIKGEEIGRKGADNSSLIEQHLEVWCLSQGFDIAYIKSLTTQKTQGWATSTIYQGFGYFDAASDSTFGIVTQRALKDERNEWGTYINLINDDHHNCFIEGVQFFQVLNTDNGSLTYIKTTTVIDLQTEIATINIYHPTTEYEGPFSHHQPVNLQANNDNNPKNAQLISPSQKIREKIYRQEQRIAQLEEQLNDSFVNVEDSTLSTSDLGFEKLNSTIDNRELVSSNNSDSNPHTD